MKIQITFKDPDRVGDAVQQAVSEAVHVVPDLSTDERDMVMDARMERTWEDLEKFIEYQEYVTIEIDTEAGTARVVPVSES
jgi:hypothetical protein